MIVKAIFVLTVAVCAFELGRLQSASGKGLIEWCKDAVIVAVALVRSVLSVLTGGGS